MIPLLLFVAACCAWIGLLWDAEEAFLPTGYIVFIPLLLTSMLVEALIKWIPRILVRVATLGAIGVDDLDMMK
jgi:hypothetical protein